jgi:DNA (cytosine-5)-methyltransferase 1
MGLPDGWVTDVPGLSRNRQLTLLGNGVVPRQGATALAALLTRLPGDPLTTYPPRDGRHAA